jgi:hypothetical protein
VTEKRATLIVNEVGGRGARLEIDVDEDMAGTLNLPSKDFDKLCERLYKGFHGIPEKVN